MHLVAVGNSQPAVFAVGQQATGIIAIGQAATGFVAIGQLSTGVIAVGQLARGGIVVGQLALGVFCVGQLAIGVVWAMGMLGVGAVSGPSLLVLGLFGRLTRRRLVAWLRRAPWDSTRLPAWRIVAGTAGVAALGALWWFVTGQTLVQAWPAG